MEFLTLFLTIYLTIGTLIGFSVIKVAEKFASDHENGKDIPKEAEILLKELSLIYRVKGEKRAILMILLTSACFWMMAIFKNKKQ